MNIQLSHPCNKLPPVPHHSKHKHISSWFIKSSANPNRFVPFRPWNLPEFERFPTRSARRNYRRTLSLFHVRYPVTWTHTLTIVNLRQLLTNDNKRERLCRAKCNSFTNHVWKVADGEFTFMYLNIVVFYVLTFSSNTFFTVFFPPTNNNPLTHYCRYSAPNWWHNRRVFLFYFSFFFFWFRLQLPLMAVLTMFLTRGWLELIMCPNIPQRKRNVERQKGSKSLQLSTRPTTCCTLVFWNRYCLL